MCLYEAQISGERLQDHWSSGFAITCTSLMPYGSICSLTSYYFGLTIFSKEYRLIVLQAVFDFKL